MVKQSQQLGQENITKLIIRFSLPAIIGMMVNALYNVVDRIFVGNGVGSLAIAGITVVFPLMLVMLASTMLIGIGASTLISIRLGQQKEQEAQTIMGNAVVLMILLSSVITIAGLIFIEPIMTALGASELVLPYATGYGRIILLGTPFLMIGLGMNNFIRAEGNPRIAMLTMIIGALTNIALDALFIFGFGWGIEGAAIATVISKGVSATWVLYYFLSGNSALKLVFRNIKLEWNVVISILALGAAPFSMQLAASVLSMVLNKSLNSFGGDLALSGMGVVSSIATLFLMPIFGINQGLQPIIGYNYGAKKFDRVKDALTKGMIVATTFSVFGYIIISLFPSQLVSLFNRADAELINFGARALRIYMFCMPVIGFQAVGAIYFQAVGKPKHAAFLSLSRQVLILIPLIIILPRFFGLDGIFYAGPIADLSSATLTGCWVFFELRKLGSQKTMPDLAADVEPL